MAIEVVTVISNQYTLNSWRTKRDGLMREGFSRTMSHNAFTIPLWIHLLSQPRNGFWHYLCLLWLIINNNCRVIAACQTFFSTLPPNPQEDSTEAMLEAWDRSLPILELVGATLWVLPPNQIFRHLGLIMLLCLVCPLSHFVLYRQKKKHGVVYVTCDASVFDYQLIRHLMQTRSMGTKLIVGIIDKTTTVEEDHIKKDTMVKNICSISSVDEVITGAPIKVDLSFLERHGVDCVVGTEVTNEVIREGKCWILQDVDHYHSKVRQVMTPTLNSVKQ